MSAWQKILLYLGVLLIILSFVWPYLSKLPIGRLPGDIYIDKPNFKLYFPITTMLLLSVIVSFILWLFRK
ncbi:DUF2905 domain-containing protein [Caldithrix abyssi]|uniref:DUF2905 domain-containing protein n=1 Tax=Caldithrix abyssi DSM 13497 TaxID=880073 RepID=H1XX76_CALAY|nr:DUF2905 domain-containing protein [Caldithrix abyssi]APF20686.1 Protein of unknown function (DUF2905) [Caldithrix abyssi DSM 13497]EHO40813.1 hypothetical protein Calab_1187 [Caldithrix abyssi DSM 13497]